MIMKRGKKQWRAALHKYLSVATYKNKHMRQLSERVDDIRHI